jgi:hypothetical protein
MEGNKYDKEMVELLKEIRSVSSLKALGIKVSNINKQNDNIANEKLIDNSGLSQYKDEILKIINHPSCKLSIHDLLKALTYQEKELLPDSLSLLYENIDNYEPPKIYKPNKKHVNKNFRKMSIKNKRR